MLEDVDSGEEDWGAAVDGEGDGGYGLMAVVESVATAAVSAAAVGGDDDGVGSQLLSSYVPEAPVAVAEVSLLGEAGSAAVEVKATVVARIVVTATLDVLTELVAGVVLFIADRVAAAVLVAVSDGFRTAPV